MDGTTVESHSIVLESRVRYRSCTHFIPEHKCTRSAERFLVDVPCSVNNLYSNQLPPPRVHVVPTRWEIREALYRQARSQSSGRVGLNVEPRLSDWGGTAFEEGKKHGQHRAYPKIELRTFPKCVTLWSERIRLLSSVRFCCRPWRFLVFGSSFCLRRVLVSLVGFLCV